MCQINLFKNEQKTTNYCRYFTLNINYEMEYNYGIIDYIKIQLLKVSEKFKHNLKETSIHIHVININMYNYHLHLNSFYGIILWSGILCFTVRLKNVATCSDLLNRRGLFCFIHWSARLRNPCLYSTMI